MEPVSPKPAPASRKDVLPDGQFELATLAEAAAVAWEKSPLPALLWCPKAQLRDMAAAYRAGLGTADVAAATLSPAAQRLAALDRETSAGLKFVKNYLEEKYGETEAKSYYDEFGIPRGKWATARPKRAAQLLKLVQALSAHQFDKNKYGTAYWQPLATEYAQLTQASSTNRQAAAGETGKKNVQEKPLRQVLRALRLSIRANFPDTYAAQLREFGFLAESF